MLSGCPADTHVHLHRGVDPARCLDAAAGHMGAEGVLFVLEAPGCTGVEALPPRAGAWSIRPTAEAITRRASRADGACLWLIGGRQVVARGGLEVLSLGAAAGEDGGPLEATMAEIVAAGGLAVLPWGVGKWTGARGRAVAALVEEGAPPPDTFLADSGVRPALLPRPALLRRAERHGWRVLAGTDPLPLPGEERKPGRFGIRLPHAPDPARPFASVAAMLRAQEGSPPTYGRLESLPRALRQQVAMQLRKRRR
ncbi:hypothetical protein [Jannaschia sp. W003]|uniref:hypothetical protein n=1 Tax=Jannaschia sp. W003 TaxID=2867012 RepID=UPI0021A336EA|nr:hypothetical protein [Jannaschia sp. W003]UWQ21578.1 hypothetical protein K3554_00655 [Jannaschia sp. W003]